MKPSEDDLPDKAEIDLLHEKAFREQPRKISSVEGIAGMEKRLAHLRDELRRCSEAAEKFPNLVERYVAEMADIRRQLDETEALLKEYKAREQERN